MRFSTLAKLIAVYECSLEDLLEVEWVSAAGPLYLGALAAFADGTLLVTGPQCRSVRRSASYDVITEDEEQTWAPSEPLSPRRRRSPIGTVHQ